MPNQSFNPDAASTGSFPLLSFRFLVSSQRAVVGHAGELLSSGVTTHTLSIPPRRQTVNMLNKHNVVEISANELSSTFLDDFNRFQQVTFLYRGPHINKTKQFMPFLEEWCAEAKQAIISEMLDNLKSGGSVFGLYLDNILVGFASIGGDFIDPNHQYRQLLELHISTTHRGNGLGKLLFQACVDKLRALGTEKMYISAHSSIETVSFYKNLGCIEAQWLFTEQVNKEPFDYQLEFSLLP